MRTQKTLPRLVILLAALAISIANAQLAVGQPIASTQLGDCGVIVMRDGNLISAGFEGPRVCPWQQGAWVLRGNIFLTTGRGVSPVVGMNQYYGQVLTANGDWFQLGVSSSCETGASFVSNVFDVTGIRAPGEEFVEFGGAAAYEYAVTTYDRIFRWSGCSGWELVGALSGGPTSSSRSSWGGLKTIYR